MDFEQFDAAYGHCVDFAQRMLREFDTFLPFGAALLPSGGFRGAGAWTGEDHPQPSAIFDLMMAEFRRDAADGTIIGSIAVVDYLITADFEACWPDGICLHLEGRGYSQVIFIPYAIRRSGLFGRRREVAFADPFAVEADAKVFLS